MICEATRNKLGPVVVTLLRVSTGLIMALHGWGKLTDIPKTVEGLTSMGLPSPEIMVYLAIAGEFLGGLGLLIGFLTPIAALGILCTMAVAVFRVHFSNGLIGQGGFEYPLTLLFVALFFVIHGAGPYSVDQMCCGRCCKKGTTEI